MHRRSSFRRDHNECRNRVCACCGIKAPMANTVTAALQSIIQQEIYPAYDRLDLKYPNGLCGACHDALQAAKRGQGVPMQVRQKWAEMDFSIYSIPSNSSATCRCVICLTDRKSLTEYKQVVKQNSIVEVILVFFCSHF